MVCCAAYGCNNRTSRQAKSIKNMKELAPKVTFHKFPKNSDRRNAWAGAVRRVGWVPNGNSVLCSAHFTEDAFDRTSMSCVRLRDTAVPSIFPSHLQNKKSPESTSESVMSEITPSEHINTMDVVDVLPSTSSALPDTPPLGSLPLVTIISPKTTRSISTMTSCSPMSSVETVLRQKYKDMKLNYQKRIKVLQQSERRHVKQIAALKSVLATFKNKNNVTHDEHSYMKKLPGTNAA